MQTIPWRALRAAVLQRDGRRCQRCRGTLRLTVHHIKPRDQGGTNDPRNLLTLCSTCHDWAELEVAKRELTWTELTARPPREQAVRIWYLDENGVVCAEIVGDEAEVSV